jgi:hypothetical protein
LLENNINGKEMKLFIAAADQVRSKKDALPDYGSYLEPSEARFPFWNVTCAKRSYENLTYASS